MEEEIRVLPRKAKETVTLETRHRLAIVSRVGGTGKHQNMLQKAWQVNR